MAFMQTVMRSRQVVLDPPEEGLESCTTCGHSRRNHEEAAHQCARSLCACVRFG